MAGSSHRRYSRLDRVNQLIAEVVADELELIEDERLAHLGMVTVTGASVDADLRRARVWIDSLAPLPEVVEALERHRVRLQGAIGRQARLRRTPELSFVPDPAIAAGSTVDQILRALHVTPDEEPPAAKDGSP